jgi:hypothetical protein
MDMTHPCSALDQSPAFLGDEVEGKVCLGLRTAIIRRELSLAEWQAVVEQEPEHLFLTEQFEAWEWAAEEIVPWARSKDIQVTAGRTAEQVDAFFLLPVAEKVRLMVRVWGCKWHAQLRPTDEISIGEPYHMITVPVSQGQVTVPADYANDKAIIL